MLLRFFTMRERERERERERAQNVACFYSLYDAVFPKAILSFLNVLIFNTSVCPIYLIQ